MAKSRDDYIKEQGGDDITFNLVDKNTVKRLQKKGDVELPYKDLDEEKDEKWNTKLLNSKLMENIVSGKPVTELASSIYDVVGRNEKSAMRNARTMLTGAENAGRQDSYSDLTEQGVVMKKVWIATPDDHTRESHFDLDGEEVDVDEEFSNGCMYPGDPNGDPSEVYNCRCSMRTHIVGFKAKDGSVVEVKGDRDKTMHEEQMEAEESRREEKERQKEERRQVKDEVRTIEGNKMDKQEYERWQSEKSTRKIIDDEFEAKYGVSLEDALIGRGDVWLDDEKMWLQEKAQKVYGDVDIVTSSYGGCGYIQNADGSKAINAYLRRGEVDWYKEKDMKQTIEAMNRLIDRTTLDQDLIVDRCAGIDALKNMGIDIGETGSGFRIGHSFCTEGVDVQGVVNTINNDYIGSEIIDKGFMSASVSADNNVFGGSDVTFTILAPEGTHAYISDNLVESEIVFAPGTKQEIVGARVQERVARDYEGKETKRQVVEVLLKII